MRASLAGIGSNIFLSSLSFDVIFVQVRFSTRRRSASLWAVVIRQLNPYSELSISSHLLVPAGILYQGFLAISDSEALYNHLPSVCRKRIRLSTVL